MRWTYAVHEQILPALRRANVPVRWTDLTVRHTGYIDPALRECKLQRDCKILDAELHVRKAVLHRKAGQPAEAEASWRRILTLKRPDQFCSVDQGIYGHLTLRNLAVLAEERGDRLESQRLWRMVLDACPGDLEAMAHGDAAH